MQQTVATGRIMKMKKKMTLIIYVAVLILATSLSIFASFLCYGRKQVEKSLMKCGE